MPSNSQFTGVDRLKLIKSIMEADSKKRGAQLNIEELVEAGVLAAAYPLHADGELYSLMDRWIRFGQILCGRAAAVADGLFVHRLLVSGVGADVVCRYHNISTTVRVHGRLPGEPEAVLAVFIIYRLRMFTGGREGGVSATKGHAALRGEIAKEAREFPRKEDRRGRAG